MEQLVRPELVHTSFRLKEEDFYQMIDNTGGWPDGFKYVSFYHDGPIGNRYCKFTNVYLRTGWWTTICNKGQYLAWKFKQNMRTRKQAAPAPLSTCKDSLQVQSAPLPLPADIEQRLQLVRNNYSRPVEADLRDYITDLTRRLAEAEAERDECQHELVSLRHTLDDLVAHQRTRAEAAEAQRDEANAAAHCNKAALDELAVQLRAEEARVEKLEKVRQMAKLVRECTTDPTKLCHMMDEALAGCEEVGK